MMRTRAARPRLLVAGVPLALAALLAATGPAFAAGAPGSSHVLAADNATHQGHKHKRVPEAPVALVFPAILALGAVLVRRRKLARP